MNWKQKIEAQIATIDRFPKYLPSGLHTSEITALLRQLLDVAVAADAWSCVEPIAARQAESDLHDALDKLREAGDGH